MTTTPRLTDFSIAAILTIESPRTNILHKQDSGDAPPCGEGKKTFTSPLYLERPQTYCNVKVGPRLTAEDDTVPADITSLIRVCDGRTVYNCVYCKYHTIHRGSFKNHILTHTGEKPYKCDVCKKRFTWASIVTRHYRTHTRDKPYKCTECSYSSCNGSHLNIHISVKQTSERRYECSECDYKTAISSHLTVHMRTHTGEKPYHCPDWEYRASHKNSLTRHIAGKHTSERRYRCTECDYKTTVRSYLSSQMKIHTGEKPYHCPDCDFRASHKNSLARHIARMHK